MSCRCPHARPPGECPDETCSYSAAQIKASRPVSFVDMAAPVMPRRPVTGCPGCADREETLLLGRVRELTDLLERSETKCETRGHLLSERAAEIARLTAELAAARSPRSTVGGLIATTPVGSIIEYRGDTVMEQRPRCEQCNRSACKVAEAEAHVAAVMIPVTPGVNGCDCHGTFARSHNPSRGCKIHGEQSEALDNALTLRQAAHADCLAHAVDWRACTLLAEEHLAKTSDALDRILARIGATDSGGGGQTIEAGEARRITDGMRRLDALIADAGQWRNAVSGAKEPGDPVIRAIAALLHCTYLDTLPTPPDDDFRRELAVAGRVAHDLNRDARIRAEARISSVVDAIEGDLAKVVHYRAARSNGGQYVGTGGPLGHVQPSAIAYIERILRDLRAR